MSKSASQRIFTRFRTSILALLVLLFIAVLFQHYKKRFEIDSNGVFVPVSLINQTKSAIEIITQSHTPSIDHKFPCSDRQLLILGEYISENSSQTIEDAQLTVKRVWSDLEVNGLSPSCKNFPQVIKNAFKAIEISKTEKKISLDRIIKENYVENLSWERSSLCMYAEDEFGTYIVSGSYNRCKNENVKYSENTEARSLIKKEIKPIVSLARNQGNLSKDDSNFFLTVDSTVNYQLRQMLACEKSSCNPLVKQVLDQAEFATIVILDATNNEILATACHGEKCNNRDNEYLGLLKGSNIEVPPASTAKLIFSLALSQNNRAMDKELGFQIKTSGQLDQSVKKRNEWWEKMATCNEANKDKNCKVPELTANFAKKLGWNQYCEDKPQLMCGNSQIFTPLGITKYSPVAGRLLVQSKNNGPYLNTKNLTGNYLDWNTYDAVRTGKKTNLNSSQLEKTSLVIQSVIGAGDNRTTSLGLAMMGSGIYQASTSGSIKPPTIFKKQISKSNTEISQSTATSVLKGMQKVVMPSEKGWIGDGTANGAFTRVFGKSCGDNCPIFAKTGTVSYQDKVYGGTTLFTGIVLTNELRKFKDPESKGNKRNLAIGVICKAKNKNTEHLASKLGMLAFKEIALHD
jgi:hypothetical protein